MTADLPPCENVQPPVLQASQGTAERLQPNVSANGGGSSSMKLQRGT